MSFGRVLVLLSVVLLTVNAFFIYEQSDLITDQTSWTLPCPGEVFSVSSESTTREDSQAVLVVLTKRQQSKLLSELFKDPFYIEMIANGGISPSGRILAVNDVFSRGFSLNVSEAMTFKSPYWLQSGKNDMERILKFPEIHEKTAAAEPVACMVVCCVSRTIVRPPNSTITIHPENSLAKALTATGMDIGNLTMIPGISYSTAEKEISFFSKHKFCLISNIEWPASPYSQKEDTRFSQVLRRFYHCLLGGSVPIVENASLVETIAPMNSYVRVEDFSHLEELKDYIQFLDGNDEEYLKYFLWKGNGLPDALTAVTRYGSDLWTWKCEIYSKMKKTYETSVVSPTEDQPVRGGLAGRGVISLLVVVGIVFFYQRTRRETPAVDDMYRPLLD